MPQPLPPGTGTALNAATILLGSAAGVLVGERLPDRTREVVTDGLGFVTLLVAGLNARAVLDADLAAAVGTSAPVLIVLGSLLVGGIVGSLLGLETRLEALGGSLQRRLTRRGGAGQSRFVEGFVAASLVFCVGPLAILGALEDGLGQGFEQLALKATLDGFASVAFAASLGWGVAASILPVVAIQGTFTVLGVLVGDILPAAHVAALTAVGGLLLVGVAIRLLRLRQLPVADLLPALRVAPLLVALVTRLQ